MKYARTAFHFFHQSLISTLVLILIMSSAIFCMTHFLGEIKFFNYSQEILMQSDLEGSLYFMPLTYTSDSRSGAAKRDIERQNFSAVEYVFCPQTATTVMNGKYVNVMICDETYLDIFNFADEGKWLAESGVQEDEVVVCGYLFDQTSISSQLSLHVNWMEKGAEPVYENLTVIGKKTEPSYLPSLGMRSSEVSAHQLLTQGHNTLLMKEGNLSRKLFGDSNLYHENCFIKLKESASPSEKDILKKYLLSKGTFLSFNRIMDNTERNITTQLKKNLPLPLFLLLVSTVSFFSITTLQVTKKMPDYCIFILCGCSRKKIFFLILFATSLVGIFAGLINAAFVLCYPSLSSLGLETTRTTILESDMIIWVSLYSLGCILLSICITYWQIRKVSPVEIYWRLHK